MKDFISVSMVFGLKKLIGDTIYISKYTLAMLVFLIMLAGGFIALAVNLYC